MKRTEIRSGHPFPIWMIAELGANAKLRAEKRRPAVGTVRRRWSRAQRIAQYAHIVGLKAKLREGA
jgi:hypothetical protein